jgi:hypothetical protein
MVKLVSEFDLHVSVFNCPHKNTNLRTKIKPIIKKLTHIDKFSIEQILMPIILKITFLLKMIR